MKIEEYKKRIAVLLTRIKAQVELFNAIHYFDINITSETFFADLLNLIFDWKLENLNSQGEQSPYVDLYDKTRNIYVQVTSEKTSQKIKDTILGIESSEFINDKTKLYIFLLIDKPKYKSDFITEKIKFNTKDNILDIKSIVKKTDGLPLKKLKLINDFLEENLDARDEKEKRICSEEQTLINIIEVLSREEQVLKDIPSKIDPEFKIEKRFSDFSNLIKKEYVDLYLLYHLQYLKVTEALFKNEAKVLKMNNYLKSTSIEVLQENDNNPQKSLTSLVKKIYALLSSTNKEYDKCAIRFFLINQIIECNVFPNEV